MKAMKITLHPTVRRVGGWLLKAGLIALVLGLLISQRRHLLPHGLHVPITAHTFWIVLAALSTVCLGLFAVGRQLQLLLRHMHFDISYRKALGLLLIGSFFGTVIPGMGEDAAKVTYLCRHLPERTPDAMAAILVDRVISAVAFVGIGILGLPFLLIWHLIPQQGQIMRYLPGVIAVTTLGVSVLYWQRRRIAPLLRKALQWAPASVHRFSNALSRFAREPRLLLACTGCSLANYILSIACLWCCSLLIHGHFSLAVYLILIGVFRKLIQYPVFILGGGLAFLFLKFHRPPPQPVMARALSSNTRS
jgi:uncharacterized membrane protein YbhN (UPF0104 family)